MAYMLFRGIEGAELESAVCPAQKWLIRPKNRKVLFFTTHGRNMNEVCFCMFSNMKNPTANSDL